MAPPAIWKAAQANPQAISRKKNSSRKTKSPIARMLKASRHGLHAVCHCGLTTGFGPGRSLSQPALSSDPDRPPVPQKGRPVRHLGRRVRPPRCPGS